MSDCITNSLGCSSLSQAVKHDKANTRKICLGHQFWCSCARLQACLCFNITSVNVAIALSSAILTTSASVGYSSYIIFMFRRKLCPVTPGLLTPGICGDSLLCKNTATLISGISKNAVAGTPRAKPCGAHSLLSAFACFAQKQQL